MEVGDVVRLKSGSLPMTIHTVFQRPEYPNGVKNAAVIKHTARLMWFDPWAKIQFQDVENEDLTKILERVEPDHTYWKPAKEAA